MLSFAKVQCQKWVYIICHLLCCYTTWIIQRHKRGIGPLKVVQSQWIIEILLFFSGYSNNSTSTQKTGKHLKPFHCLWYYNGTSICSLLNNYHLYTMIFHGTPRYLKEYYVTKTAQNIKKKHNINMVHCKNI